MISNDAALPIIVFFSSPARELAQRLAHHLNATLAGPDKARQAILEGYSVRRPLIGVCAAGILIRILAPMLKDKHGEPPVVAVATDGSCAVPLLGAHHGANALCQKIAALTGGHAAITTASDLCHGVAFDDPPAGYALANPEDAKAFTAQALSGAALTLNGHAPWLKAAPLRLKPAADLRITVTDHSLTGGSDHLVYHPRTLALGVGCERHLPAKTLEEHVTRILRQAGLSEKAIACVCSIDLKSDEEAVHALAAFLGVPARFFSPEELNAQAHRLATPSPVVLRETGCPGVSEAAALAAAGEQSRLIVDKAIGRGCTCAVAQSCEPIIALPGQPRGRLAVVGIGPGDAAWRVPAATRALLEARHWVGYRGYLGLLDGLAHDAQHHPFALGEEEKRVRHALALAGEGEEVALICSGDPGIYAMASLVFEILDQGGLCPQQQRIAVTVIPGISALQAGAAAGGALLGHDFCAISLSDLLTPWAVIEKRLAAAAASDFVIALYNPRSRTRTRALGRALEIIGEYRGPDTPAVIAARLGRSGEEVNISTLDALKPETVDMMTIVLIGATTSRLLQRGDGIYAYTPRGYTAKRNSTMNDRTAP